MKEIYQNTKAEVLEQLQTTVKGISSEEAEKRLTEYGPNQLEEKKGKSLLRIFVDQFCDFLVIILIISAFISGILGDLESAIVIVVVITINAILGTYQTVKAEASLKSLKSLATPNIQVVRNGETIILAPEQVTVGDVVMLEAGNYVCADGRIIVNKNLKVDESSLTGESVPVEKEDKILYEETPLGDRCNMVFAGSYVTYGRGSYVVTDIGMQTQLGEIAGLLNATAEKKTPLQVTLDRLGKTLSYIIIGICAVVFGLSMWRGEAFVDAFIFAVALAVAAIPEALSSIITIMLSMGTQTLAKEHAIIRKLQAVEALGSVSVICSDKTGTLTQNKMTVQRIYVDGNTQTKDQPLSELGKQLVIDSILCNDAIRVDGKEVGDPTETALLVFASDKEVENSKEANEKRVSEIPFDSDRKIMSIVIMHESNYKMISKGAVDVLLPLIHNIQMSDGIRDINDEDKEKIRRGNQAFSESGLRVLAICERCLETAEIDESYENSYTFIGLIAMQDPPREEAFEAVATCKKAGIRPVMITGDHLLTAAAIAKDIGILEEGDKAIEGADIEHLTVKELEELVPQVAVYARVSPEHKIRIVKTWQRLNYIVSMTGDGVNDAPALKQADIGVAMGITGSEVAKESADMVLADDNFATIVKAVEYGRNLYANIQRALQFLLSGNTAGIIVVMIASIFALPVPFAAVHLLFINLLTDSLPAIALGLEPHDKMIMEEKPRMKSEDILTKQILKTIACEGAIIAVTVIIAFYIGMQDNVATARTMAFATLCLGRLVHGFNCKSQYRTLGSSRFFNNKALLGAFAIGVCLLMSVLWIPVFRQAFQVVMLNAVQMIAIVALAFSNLFIIQAKKKFVYCESKKEH